MGGTVAETIRKEDGSIIKMARKTGVYNYMFFSKEFNNGEVDKAVTEHINIFLEMKEDFESGEPYKYEMSPVYGGFTLLAPVDYGLVVIDIKNKKIHSMQDFDEPGFIHIFKLSNSVIFEKKILDAYNFLIENNKLIIYKNEDLLGDCVQVFGENASISTVQNIINENEAYSLSDIKRKFKHEELFYLRIMPDGLKDFEFISYDDSEKELLKYATNLVSDGFEFSDEEINTWLEYSERYFEFLDIEGEDLSDDEYDSKLEEAFASYKNELMKILKNNQPLLSRKIK